MMENSMASVDEAARTSRRRGGWITFPFIIGAMGCLALSAGGWAANLIVYLIQEFNIKSISAAKIYNFVNGSITLFPIVGAVIADSFLTCFSVICFSSLISLLGVLLLLLTAAINSLKPPECSNACKYPTPLQLGILYLSLSLASLGNAGTRFTIATMGADQFDHPKNQAVFFNWYIFTMYTATVVSSTAVVYVEDNISWTWGFAIAAVANLVGFLVLFSGRRFYRINEARRSPFRDLVRVVVAAVRKRKMIVSEEMEDYCYALDEDGTKPVGKEKPTHFFRFLNRAALYSEGDTTRPWKLCTLQQVENLKTLIKILPLWSTGLSLCTPLAIQLSLTVVQALTMDRRVGSQFKIPAGSMPVFILISTSLFIFVIDRFALPLWEKLTQRPLTLLRRVGIGHALTITSMAVSAAVEAKRLRIARSNITNTVVPMSVLWLVPQLAIAGLGEAFHFPGQIAFYYQEFPACLKSTSTAAVALFIGIAFYSSNAIIDLVRSVTHWLPDNINYGRLDNLYWLCCIIGGLNFVYYLICSSFYKYQHPDESADDCTSS